MLLVINHASALAEITQITAVTLVFYVVHAHMQGFHSYLWTVNVHGAGQQLSHAQRVLATGETYEYPVAIGY